MARLNILVIGGGGREHALVWKINQSPLVEKIFCAPGNPGIGEIAECVELSASDLSGLLNFVHKHEIDLTVVGPEAPLVEGIVDSFTARGLNIFGPSKRAAEIEGSKVFAKSLLNDYNIPTANYRVFDNHEEACRYLEEVSYPTVIKADGLAAGKGALICKTKQAALAALEQIMVTKSFGEAGSKVVVEEFMVGEEASVIALTDGENIAYLPPSQDHKAIFDNDEGPNTGGMGAYAPAPVIDDAMMERVHREIMLPTVNAMALENRPYRGVLYAGLVITRDGPKVIEFNCRLGDPEAQVVLPLVKSDLVEVMFRIATGKRIDPRLALHDKWALCVVLASGGYPGRYEKGKVILGLDGHLRQQVVVFHAGTRSAEKGKIVTDGGRVLGLTAVADDFHSVREQAYQAVGKVTFDKAYFRRDIGNKARRHLSRASP
ncbi:MAG: phosphoribosylamine--glycine ligase [bacterium]